MERSDRQVKTRNNSGNQWLDLTRFLPVCYKTVSNLATIFPDSFLVQ